MIVAPFFGIRWDGCARWLNRVLLASELVFAAMLITVQITDPIVDAKWFVYLLAAVLYLGASVINGMLHKLNCVVIALYYGSTDPHEIAMKIKAREAHRKSVRKGFEEEGIHLSREIDL